MVEEEAERQTLSLMFRQLSLMTLNKSPCHRVDNCQERYLAQSI